MFIEKYLNSQHEICKKLFEVLYAVIQKQFHVIIIERERKRKKQRIKVLTIGLEWDKCGRVTISVHFPKLKITLVSKLYLLE